MIRDLWHLPDDLAVVSRYACSLQAKLDATVIEA